MRGVGGYASAIFPRDRGPARAGETQHLIGCLATDVYQHPLPHSEDGCGPFVREPRTRLVRRAYSVRR
jgi:hypothetical protein